MDIITGRAPPPALSRVTSRSVKSDADGTIETGGVRRHKLHGAGSRATGDQGVAVGGRAENEKNSPAPSGWVAGRAVRRRWEKS